jgi:hypothetical protein
VEGLRPMATRLPTFILMRRPVRPNSASVCEPPFLIGSPFETDGTML